MTLERFERRTVTFCQGVSVDGYRLADGEFRVGIAGASKVIGFAENWLSLQLSRTDGKTLKWLQGIGFTAYLKTGTVAREGVRGASKVSTISLDDFVLLIAFCCLKT
jgi:hypothetical protein